MKDIIRLREIEIELDRTDLWEQAPYRNVRRKLGRERNRILRRLNGKDPNWFASGAGSRAKEARGVKSGIVAILNEMGK